MRTSGTPNTIIKIVLLLMAAVSLVMFASVAAEYFRLSRAEHAAATPAEETPGAPPTPSPSPTPKPIPEEVKRLMEFIPATAAEISARPGMFGRLVFPDAGINTALFTDGPGETIAEKRQGLCDAPDSAALYYDAEGAVIADHNTQAFAALTQVLEGQKAYIITADSVLELVCTRLIDGHNDNHRGIVDENYVPLRNVGDFICYTCKEVWLDVRIVVLDMMDEYSFYN